MTFDLSGAPTAALDEARRVLLPPDLPPNLDLGGGFATRPIHTLAGATMGTYWRARIVERPSARSDDAEQANAILAAAFAEVVALMSPWEPESDLARFARTAPGEWVALAPATARVLGRALEIAALTDGAYSPALGEVTALLGFGPGDPEARRAIDSPEVRAARARADFRHIELDATLPTRPAARQKRAHGSGNESNSGRDGERGGRALHIDLCSIAKGYAIDLASERLHADGWHHHFIEIGGEAIGRGCKPNGQPWWCYLETPAGAKTEPHTLNQDATTPQAEEREASSDSTVAGLCELAVATSGNAYHHFEDEHGKSIGHILRPEDFRKAHVASAAQTQPIAAETSAPSAHAACAAPTRASEDQATHPPLLAESDALQSVTVFAATCMEADAWATALYALGPERGLPLAQAQRLAARWLVRPEGNATAALREIITPEFQRLID